MSALVGLCQREMSNTWSQAIPTPGKVWKRLCQKNANPFPGKFTFWHFPLPLALGAPSGTLLQKSEAASEPIQTRVSRWPRVLGTFWAYSSKYYHRNEGQFQENKES